ncbi:MAG: lipid-A-disaccharide synthase [Candidatus Kryptonium sp.]
MPKKLMVVAGEASGDSHAGKVACAIKKISPDFEIFGVGGEKMRRCGVEIIYDISGISFIGFVDVVKNFKKIIHFENLCKDALLSRKPDAVLLVDYPGFNLRFAKFAKENGFRVFYYIAPQVWAWGRGRIRILKNYVDELFVIFKFEEEFFRRYEVKAEFVGHPLLEDLREVEFLNAKDFFGKYKIEKEKIVSFFPGSRAHEVRMMLKTMMDAAEAIKDFGVEVIFSKARLVDESEIKRVAGERFDKFKFVEDSHSLLKFSHIAIVKSGTTSLEAGILGIPMVVCYKTSFLNYIIGKTLIKTDVIESISLPNIVLDRKVVPELIQNDFTKEKILNEVEKYLSDENLYQSVKNELLKIKQLLVLETDGRTASEIVAERIISKLH